MLFQQITHLGQQRTGAVQGSLPAIDAGRLAALGGMAKYPAHFIRRCANSTQQVCTSVP
ncbi:hypothetical protein D3C76_1838390 [compost metagenome]